MDNEKIYKMSFSKIYPLLVNKVMKKGRTQDEADEVICWLTGYSKEDIPTLLENGIDYGTFFKDAPAMNENRFLIKGTICGIKVENIDDPLMRDIRYLDKLRDELAKGKAMEKILRKQENV